MDGMTAYNTNVQQAIDLCLEKVSPDNMNRITIDVLICEKDSPIAAQE